MAAKKKAEKKPKTSIKKSTANSVVRANSSDSKVTVQRSRQSSVGENLSPQNQVSVASKKKVIAGEINDVSVAVIGHSHEGKFILLESVLQKSGFWFNLQHKLYRSGKTQQDFSIVIKPDFNAYELIGSTATDPQLVEHLIDLLYERGYQRVIVAESRDSSDMWLENRDVQILADVLGYQYVTPAGHDYDVLDLSEQTVQGCFGKNSILSDSKFSEVWLTSDYHILFSKNKTDDENAFYLGLNNLLSVLPLTDKDYHYKHRLDKTSVLIELLDKVEIDFCLVDALISNHGNGGSRFAQPLITNTLIAGADLLLTDYAAVQKMGAQIESSPIHKQALQEIGLPSHYRIDGDTTPFKDWINVHPLILESTRKRSQWKELDQILKPWLQTVDIESFAFQDPLNANFNQRVSQYMQCIDSNPNVFWIIVSLNYLLSLVHDALESFNIVYRKDRLWHKEVALNIDIDDYPLAAYRAMVDYLEPLESKTRKLESDSNGLRWEFHQDGSVLFEYSRVIPVDYDDFVGKVDISKSIQYMNDYIGGVIVPVKHDKKAREYYQVERNLYLPQPNYLTFYQGLDIDVSKLEYIRHTDVQQNMLWQTVKSENGSATHDDGIVRFIKTEQGETLVSIFGRQKFILPLFWQMVELDNYPVFKERIFNHAYSTFFNNTLANFEAIYEGREVRIGKRWVDHCGEVEQQHSPTQKIVGMVTQAQEFIEDFIPNKEGLFSSLFTAYNPQSEFLDDQGFAHFKYNKDAQSKNNENQQDQKRDLHSLISNSGETASVFWKGLSEAILKDSGIDNA